MTVTNSAIIPGTDGERMLAVVRDDGERDAPRFYLELLDCGERVCSVRLDAADCEAAADYAAAAQTLLRLEILPPDVLGLFGKLVDHAYKTGGWRGEANGRDEVRRGLHELLGIDEIVRPLLDIAASLNYMQSQR